MYENVHPAEGVFRINRTLCHLAVVWLSSEHLRGHPKGGAHQGQLPARVFDWRLYHFPGQAEVGHQSLPTSRRHPDQTILERQEQGRAVQVNQPAVLYIPTGGSVRSEEAAASYCVHVIVTVFFSCSHT